MRNKTSARQWLKSTGSEFCFEVKARGRQSTIWRSIISATKKAREPFPANGNVASRTVHYIAASRSGITCSTCQRCVCVSTRLIFGSMLSHSSWDPLSFRRIGPRNASSRPIILPLPRWIISILRNRNSVEGRRKCPCEAKNRIISPSSSIGTKARKIH